jgi:transcriptional regulator with XRE-family HTH domain
LTQTELAERVGLSTAMLSLLLHGRRQASLDSLNRIAKELGTTSEYLLGKQSDANAEFSLAGCTRDELEFIHLWRSLHCDHKEILRNLMLALITGKR